MNKRIFLKQANGNYVAIGSKAEVSSADVQFAVDSYNKANYDKMLYFDNTTGDVCMTDEVPAFMQDRLKQR